MPNKYSDNVRRVTFVIPEMDYRKIEVDAEYHKMVPGEYIRWLISKHFADFELSNSDLEIVIERIKAKRDK